jgi:glycerophosphoryl diester phosphodiesterase
MNIQLVAHRGDCQFQHENTLASIKTALNNNIQAIEIDIQFCQDGEIVLFHDDDLSRFYANSPLLKSATIADYSYQQLAQYAFAESAAKHAECIDNNPAYLAKLSDVVNLLSNYPNVTLFVEVKEIIFAKKSYQNAYNAIKKIIKPIKKQCVVMSFSYRFMRLCRKKNEKNSTKHSFKLGYVLPTWQQYNEKMLSNLVPDFIFCDEEILPATFEINKKGPIWVFYEVDTVLRLKQLYQQGARWFETFHPFKRLQQLKF